MELQVSTLVRLIATMVIYLTRKILGLIRREDIGLVEHAIEIARGYMMLPNEQLK